MSFFTFHQNNSGGSWSRPAINMIIEANSAREANGLAEEYGAYFDGYGDCQCCGDRWYELSKGDDGDPVPSIYGSPVEEQLVKDKGWPYKDDKVPYAIVYYADGTQKEYKF